MKSQTDLKVVSQSLSALKVSGAGSLVVVGTGIQWGGQTTLAARQAIEVADKVLFFVADEWTAQWVRKLNASAESLPYPLDGRPRRQIYLGMADQILAEVRTGVRVCAVFYGHPGVLTFAGHDAIRRARDEGFSASMLPGVSSLDCMFSDLGLDPGQDGCQMFEATVFLTRPRTVDVHTPLVLFQIGGIGNHAPFDGTRTVQIRSGLLALSEALCRGFPASHEGVIYEASLHPLRPPRADAVALKDLGGVTVSDISTLYVPPTGRAPLDERMLNWLKLISHSDGGTAAGCYSSAAPSQGDRK